MCQTVSPVSRFVMEIVPLKTFLHLFSFDIYHEAGGFPHLFVQIQKLHTKVRNSQRSS